MKRSKVTILFVLSWVFTVFSHFNAIAQTIPLDQAVKDGKVKVIITGLGGSTGDTILLNVQRKVPERLRLTMTPGTVFKSASGSVQNMIGARIKGERMGLTSYRPGSEIYLYNNAKRAYIIEAYCLDFHKPNPGSTDSFVLSPPDERASKIIIMGQKAGHSTRVIQSAIWIDRERVKSSQLKSRFPVNNKDIETARKLLREVEKSRMGKLSVKTSPYGATVRILNIKPKFYQGIELKPGRYHIEVSAKRYKTHKEWIEIGEGEDKRISVSLTADGTSEKTSHKAFIRNELTHVPSVSETTADGGVVIFKPGDGLNKIEFSVSATPMTVRVYDGKTCVLCAKIIKLAPNVKVPTGLFVNSAISKELKGASTFSVNKPFSGTISIGRSKDEYIVAGKNGAVLRKEGQGFRLMEGEAFLIVLGE